MGLSNDRLAKRFADGTTSGRSACMRIDGRFIYSYGNHFIIAERLTGSGSWPAFLFNPEKRSVSTSRHQQAVHSALTARGYKIYYANGCILSHAEKAYMREAKELHALIRKARGNLSTYQAQLYELKEKWAALRDRFKFKNEVLDTMFLLDTKAKVEFQEMAMRIAQAV